jgi:hypothetical protein
LKDQGDEVAGDEDPRVREGFDARVFGAEGRDDARETEVDACCEEGGAYCEANDLDEERVLSNVRSLETGPITSCSAYLVEHIMIREYAPSVSDDFYSAT